MMNRGLRARALALLAVAGFLVAGCSSGQSGYSAPSPAIAGDAAQPEEAEGQSAGGEASDSGSGSDSGSDSDEAAKAPGAQPRVASGQLAEQERKLARTARMTLRVKDVDEAAAEARSIAATAGGYIGSERTSGKTATLTLTVPSGELDGVLDRLEELGKRENREVRVDDVTDQVVDVDSRIKSQERSVARARELLGRADSIEDIVSIERELADREAELESLQARQKALAGQVQMAPVNLTILHREAPAPDDNDEPGGFLSGLAGGWGAFTTFLSAVATGVGAIAPFAVTLGVPVFVLIWLLRRRRGTKAPDVPVTPEPDAT